MEKQLPVIKQLNFHRLKITKKEELTKSSFFLELEVPEHLLPNYDFKSGQYVRLRYTSGQETFENDFSITSAPFENQFGLAIKFTEETSSKCIWENYSTGDEIEVSEPSGRFTLHSKPGEHRTILLFAAGIGITPIFSHLKNLLHTELRTRIFLFYGNKTSADIVFEKELKALEEKYRERLEIHYFYSQEDSGDSLYNGRLDQLKLKLIINQILHLDDTDEESTIWDAVDEILICGPGKMIQEIARGSFENGIPKKNIHFELFESFNEDIFPVKQDFPLVENIEVEFTYNGKKFNTTFEDNKMKVLQQLSAQSFDIPFSCKSGICGSCICKLEEGEVELLENEYLTQKEEQEGKILACMSVALSKKLKMNFDLE